MANFDDFVDGVADSYSAHHHQEFDEEQIEWLRIIYDEYKDEDGEIDWSEHTHDSAWYYYLTEVLDIDPADLDKYME